MNKNIWDERHEALWQFLKAFTALKYRYWNMWTLTFCDFKYCFISQWLTWKDLQFNLHFNSNLNSLKRICSLMTISIILKLFFFFGRHSLSYSFHVNVVSKIKKNWNVFSWANMKYSIYPLQTGSGNIDHTISDF